MLNQLEINVASLKLIEEELNNEIQVIAGSLEAFLMDRQQRNHLETCRDGVKQLVGTIKLLELPGGIQLAEEMLKLLDKVLKDDQSLNDRNMSAVSNAFVALPCYIEHCIARNGALPILLSPYINELRAARQKELSPESQFSGFQVPTDAVWPRAEQIPLNEDFSALIKRLRHMYHAGLLGVIRDNDLGYKGSLLQRSMARLYEVSQHTSLGELWRLTEAVLEAMAAGKLSLNLTRKRILGTVDRHIKAVQTEGSAALDKDVPMGLKKDLLFLIALADSDGPINQQVRQVYQLESPGFSDAALEKERALMQGPNAATIESVIKVLKEELTLAKEILEMAGQEAAATAPDLDSLKAILAKVSEILIVVGIEGSGNQLKTLIKQVSDWQSREEPIDSGELLDAADTVLYVESTISSLSHLSLNDADLNEADALIKQELIARSHLAEAEKVVVQEALAGLSLAKRAISSFIESNYDTVHISNVAATLATVSGGLSVLNLPRAVGILNSCIAFVESTLSQGGSLEGISQLLDTLADALISLEYYLNEVEARKDADDGILQVAEESLTSLGFPCAA